MEVLNVNGRGKQLKIQICRILSEGNRQMERDSFGICLSKSMLSSNLSSTFTHVRAYEQVATGDDVKVLHAFPQLSGQEVLANMRSAKALLWRAEFACIEQH